jgi:hypothetical protein
MKRSFAAGFECLFVSLALSVVLAACGSSSSGPPKGMDSGVDHALDVKARLDTGTDQSIDTAADRHDSGVDTLGDVPSDRTDSGTIDTHSDMTTLVPDASDAADSAHDTGPSTDVQPDVAPDLAPDVPPDLALDLAPDVSPDLSPTETGSDGTTPSDASDTSTDCGTGCPSTIHPDKLSYWFAADYGLACDNAGRVSAWTNRGTLGGQAKPATNKGGPLCTGLSMLAGRNVPYFDDIGTDDDSGVLFVDLSMALVETDYTIFVVERRQSAADGDFLGTDSPTGNPPAPDCSLYGHLQYRLGYMQSYLVSGPYVPDPNDPDMNCLVPLAMPPAFVPAHPAASLDIDSYDHTVGHAAFSDGVRIYVDTDMENIHSLTQGYLGRSISAFASGASHSRFKGDVAEVVIYSTALTADEQTAVSSYLSTRWGIGP